MPRPYNKKASYHVAINSGCIEREPIMPKSKNEDTMSIPMEEITMEAHESVDNPVSDGHIDGVETPRTMPMTELVYNGKSSPVAISINTNDLPDDSLVALWTYGYNHFLGNVQQAKVTARIRAELAKTRAVKPSAIPTSEITNWRSSHEKQVSEWLADFVSEALQDLRDGTVGVREGRAPSINERDKRINAKILKFAREQLKARGLTLPKDADGIITLPNGKVYTRSQVLENVAKVTLQDGRTRVEAFGAEVDEEMAREAAQVKPDADFESIGL